MARWKIRILLIAILTLLPYVFLMVVGCWWLYERGLLTWFAVAAAALSLVGWAIDWVFRVGKLKPAGIPAETLGAKGEENARNAIEIIAARTESRPPPLDDLEAWKKIVVEIFKTAAVQFNGKSDKPALEITVPDAMLIAELVLHDLRLDAKDHIPGSHRVTIRQIEIASKLWKSSVSITSNSSPWRLGYRLVRFLMNPVSGVFKEANDRLLGNLSITAFDQAKSWVIGYCVRRAGEYAIQLYSGQLSIHELGFRNYHSTKSEQDSVKAIEIDSRRTDEPLRVIVLGQAKAGKSSLINAIFGELRAATDSLPCTVGVMPYVLERDGLPKAIFYDTEGFAGTEDVRALSQLDKEFVRCDLIIVVCSATNAARAPDQVLLDQLRKRFVANNRRTLPPIVVALTHIDQLRPFAEWHPPYDLQDTDNVKAKNIGSCIASIEIDLGVTQDRIVPVCLRRDSIYNIRESFTPVMLDAVPDAERSKLLRLLTEYHDGEFWGQLRLQAFNSGKMLAKAALQIIPKLGKSK